MENFELLVASIAAIILAAGAYAKYFAPYQERISEAIIEAFSVPKRYKSLTNIGVGVAIAVIFTVVAAISAGLGLQVIVGGIAAGILASVNASTIHDEKKTNSGDE